MEPQQKCKNCAAIIQGNYCSACGQKVITERITVRHLFSYLFTTITNLDSGLWYTVINLVKHPGKVIQEYIGGRTRAYYHPLRLALLMGTISFLIMFSFSNFGETQENISDFLNPNADEETRALQAKIQASIKPFMNLLPILFIPFNALASKWLFGTKQINYAEQMVLHAYIYGVVVFVSLPLFIIYGYFDLFMLSPILGAIITCVFLYFTFRQIFNSKPFITIVKSMLTYILGYALFFTVVGILALVIGITNEY